MKKNSLFLLAFVLLGLMANAQIKKAKKEPNDHEAEKQLAALKSNYDSKSNYALSFDISILNPEGKEVETYSGKHTVEGSKFNLKMNTIDMISNGKTLWNINKDLKSIQISTLSGKTKKMDNPMDIISTYKKNYKYRIKEALGDNKTIVEMAPLNKNNKFFKIDLTLNTKSHELIKAKLYEKSGAKVINSISKSEYNQKIASTYFEVNTALFKEYEIVDLRD